MKKLLLFFILLISLLESKASDTHTVRQVYDFNIGDTLDYKHTQLTSSVMSSPWIQYSRIVITQKVLNNTQDTLTYNGNWIITRLDSIAIYQSDTVSAFNIVSTFVDSIFAGRNSNIIDAGFFEHRTRQVVTKGLGITYSVVIGSSDGVHIDSDATELTCYRNNTECISPRLDLTGTNDFSTAAAAISLYPNPASDILHTSLPDAARQNAILILTNLLSQQVYSSIISGTETTHDITSLPSCIYTWRIVSDNIILKTGKIVKQ